MNKKLNKAKKNKNDEFYTYYEYIEKELSMYKEQFKDKIIFCNCDNIDSDFYRFFIDNFHSYKLKKVIVTGINSNEKLIFTGGKPIIEKMRYKGDFRNTINLLSEVDIVVTNPPFSLLSTFIPLLLQYKVKFLILGSKTIVKHNKVIPYICNNNLKIGYNLVNNFFNEHRKNVTAPAYWYTNLDRTYILFNSKVNFKDVKEHIVYFDNASFIGVNKVKYLPMDYIKEIAVPISFITKYNPKQYKILRKEEKLISNGKNVFTRFIIKRI